MANVLKREKQERIIAALVEGSSVRSVERMTGVHRDTIIRLMKRVADGCDVLMDSEMRSLDCKRIQLDEIWGYVGKKQRHIAPGESGKLGDTWTWVAIDSDSKVVPTFVVGKRDAETARVFVADLASRLAHRVQLSADALHAYIGAISGAFGPEDVDFGQIVKSYEAEKIGPGRYSPPKVVATERRPVFGDPDPDYISTSYIERQNLTMRMQIRRMTRLTNAFSKTLENHIAATTLHFGWYNFVRKHSTVRTTPAIAAGVTREQWTIGDLLDIQAPY